MYKPHTKKSFYELIVAEKLTKIYKCTHCSFVKVVTTILPAIANQVI